MILKPLRSFFVVVIRRCQRREPAARAERAKEAWLRAASSLGFSQPRGKCHFSPGAPCAKLSACQGFCQRVRGAWRLARSAQRRRQAGPALLSRSEGASDAEGLLAEAAKELSSGRGGQRSSAAREGGQWQSASRSSLRSAKAEESLRDLFSTTQALRRGSPGSASAAASAALGKRCWPGCAKQRWPQGSLLFWVAAGSPGNFLALLAELLRASRRRGRGRAQAAAAACHSKKLTETQGAATSASAAWRALALAFATRAPATSTLRGPKRSAAPAFSPK